MTQADYLCADHSHSLTYTETTSPLSAWGGVTSATSRSSCPLKVRTRHACVERASYSACCACGRGRWSRAAGGGYTGEDVGGEVSGGAQVVTGGVQGGGRTVRGSGRACLVDEQCLVRLLLARMVEQ